MATDIEPERAPPKAPLSAHPAFTVLVAAWFAALLGLGTLIAPAGLLERVASTTGLGGRGTIAAVAAVVGGLIGILLARWFANAQAQRYQAARDLAIVRRRPLHVSEEVKVGAVAAAAALPMAPVVVAADEDEQPVAWFDPVAELAEPPAPEPEAAETPQFEDAVVSEASDHEEIAAAEDPAVEESAASEVSDHDETVAAEATAEPDVSAEEQSQSADAPYFEEVVTAEESGEPDLEEIVAAEESVEAEVPADDESEGGPETSEPQPFAYGFEDEEEEEEEGEDSGSAYGSLLSIRGPSTKASIDLDDDEPDADFTPPELENDDLEVARPNEDAPEDADDALRTALAALQRAGSRS